MFMLLLWLFPWSWRCKIPCMSKRVAHATLIFPSLTMLCDAKDKTKLIFMAGNSRHSSSNKWDALHKASWRSLKIIVVERRLFEKSQFLMRNRMASILQEMALRVFCSIQQKKSQHSLKKVTTSNTKKCRNKNIPVYLPQMTVVKITKNKTSPFAERVAQLRPQFMTTEQFCITPLCSHNNAQLTNQHLNNY